MPAAPRSRRPHPLLAAVLAVAACEAPFSGTGVTHGLIAIDAIEVAGEIRQLPVGQFVANSRMDPRLFSRDTCLTVQVNGPEWGQLLTDRDLATMVGGSVRDVLLAGPAIEFESAAGLDSLLPAHGGARGHEYRAKSPTGLAHTPGTSVTLRVPGRPGSFPAATATIRLAEPIAADTSSDAPDGPFRLEWVPASEPGSRVLMALRYRTGVGALAPSFDTMCSFPDAGAASVPFAVVQQWRASTRDKALRYSRVRFVDVELGRKTSLHVTSAFRVPMPSH